MLQRWRQHCDGGEDRRRGPKTAPGNKLTAFERARVLEIANSAEYRDLSPKQIVPLLADKGLFVASESSFYRILRQADELTHREPSRPRSRHKPRGYEANGPLQVWTWDITYLRSAVVGIYYYLYLFVDVWSRKIVGWRVEESESMEVSSELIRSICAELGIDPDGLVVHSDNGGPMKGSTMLATLERLGIIASFSRPSVSDDNPYSEALFRTLKYRPWYPSRPFESIEEARAWVASFVTWYNEEHLHSAIGFVTPQDRHTGRDEAILAKRREVYEEARQRHPERWSGHTRNWDRVEVVRLNPDAETKHADEAHAEAA
jgi:transposase InsO family protein